MAHQQLQWAAMSMHGTLYASDSNLDFHGVSTDTRQLNPGELFFCLNSQRDGHDFAGEAFNKQARAVVIDQKHLGLIKQFPKKSFIVVSDTLKSLGDLAHAWREQFNIPILAITGSNGKTTTKELTKAVLSVKFNLLATKGNFNNLIGVPKTLLELQPGHELAIIEMGMNDFGEIARLTEIARPTMALITNIGRAHLEKLGSLEGVARAKGELFACLASNSIALYNLADPYIAKLPSPAKKIGYGIPKSEVWGEILEEKPEQHSLNVQIHSELGTCNMNLQMPGQHNLDNALAALTIAKQFGISPERAKDSLEAFSLSNSRMEVCSINRQISLIDDCYNANPDSMEVALTTLAVLKQGNPALAILGEMLELGSASLESHYQVGKITAQNKIDYLITIGPSSQQTAKGAIEAGMHKERVFSFIDTKEAMESLQRLLEEVKWILVKGSRGAHLEQIVSFLKKA